MSVKSELTGTELLIMRAAVYAYEIARKLRLQPAEIRPIDLDQLPFVAQVARLDEAVQQAIERARSDNGDKEHAEGRLIGEVSSHALGAAHGCSGGSRDPFDQTELSNALFALGQAVGHVEVVHGPLGRLGAELVEKRIKRNSDTTKNNSARSSWHNPAISIFNRLLEERPNDPKSKLYLDAVSELAWPVAKGKRAPTAEALRREISARKKSSSGLGQRG